MEYFIIENPPNTSSIIHRGWGRGYVMVDIDHIFYGVHYSNDIFNREVNYMPHGGVTFSNLLTEKLFYSWRHITEEYTLIDKDLGKWIFGFDTSHMGDKIQNWPKERVLHETISFYEGLKSQRIIKII